MNYLVTEGFSTAASKFQEESGTEVGVDLNLLEGRIKVRRFIMEGNIDEAINVLNEL